MKKDKRMTLEEHMETADDLAIAAHHLNKAFFKCQEHYPKSSKLMRLLYRILPSAPNGIFAQTKSELDSEYHKVITDREFGKYGHIYYNLDERYKRTRQAD